MGRTYAVTAETIRKERIGHELERIGRKCSGSDAYPVGCINRAEYQVETTEPNGYVGPPCKLCTRHAKSIERSLAYWGRTNDAGQTFGPMVRIP